MLTRFSFFWQAFVRPMRAGVGDFENAIHDHTGHALQGVARDEQDDSATRAEKLERISVYARARYFEMSHCVDTYPWHGEIGPD